MKELEITQYYKESTGKPKPLTYGYLIAGQERIRSGDYIKDRSDLLKEIGVLGDREPPLFIHNIAGLWINPFMVFKFFGQKGLPIEFIIDIIGKKIGEDAGKYWYEWCNFWLETFIKGDMNLIKKNFIILD